MHVDVIVLLHGTTQAIAAWQLATDQNGQFHTVNEHRNRIRHDEAWAELAIKINQLACSGTHTPVDVFLYLCDPFLESLYNYRLLKNIVDGARNHSWAGSLYLAWDQESGTAFSTRYGGNEELLMEWFRILNEGGITDLIEVSRKARSKEKDKYNLLRACALTAENRRRDMQDLVSDDGWGVVLRDGAYFLEDFVNRLVRTKPRLYKNHFVFYDQKPRRGLTQLLDKSRNLNRNGNRIVATTRDRDLPDLEKLWEQESPILKPILFNGVFEWLYSLVRLNHASHASLPVPAVDYGRDYIEWIEPSEGMRFQSKPNDTHLRLLVTSAFHVSDGEGYCIAAAQEIGALLRGLPFHIDFEVHPCMRRDRLPDLLEARRFTAWLHLSHGVGARGLYEERIDESASPERWLTCFNAYQGSLQLVILSACESAAIARLFAASGVRVAIGFENEVLTEATRKVTEKVMSAALQRGDRQDSILGAFREACRELDSRTHTWEGGYQKHSDAGPRAFAINLKSS